MRFSGWCVPVRLGGICPLNTGHGGQSPRDSIDGGVTEHCLRSSKHCRLKPMGEDCWTGRCTASTVPWSEPTSTQLVEKRGSPCARPQPRRVRYKNPFAH
jgi:hypothetical protein